MQYYEEHIHHRTSLDGNANTHTLEPIIGLNNFLNFALGGCVILKNDGNRPDLIFNLNDSFG
jgi:hypothetical protein